MTEVASVHAKSAIDNLLHVYALTNMNRASKNSYYADTALGWLDNIEDNIKSLRKELERTSK